MATNEESSPICRGKNLSWDTILLFYRCMPTKPMPKDQFNEYMENKINAWTQTHSQLARQLAFYYEDNGICYPRFDSKTNMQELISYMQHWAANYFIPNPYSPSLKGRTPTNIYHFLVEKIKNEERNFSSSFDSVYGIHFSSHDKVKVYLSNFTDIAFDSDIMSINTKLDYNPQILTPTIEAATNYKTYFDFFGKRDTQNQSLLKVSDDILHFQQIFYGAPGTGKSSQVKKLTQDIPEDRIFRTTFHPDSDYSTFVGCYKPTTIQSERILTKEELISKLKEYRDSDMNYACHKFSSRYWESLKDLEAKEIKEILAACNMTESMEKEVSKGISIGRFMSNNSDGKIVYRFNPQAFTNAYVKAWNTTEDVYLIIEEINRGNCAQIFGDLFQLLDRRSDGFSEYPITTDTDLHKYLSGVLNVKDREGMATGVAYGEKMQLPPNLYIWATMNTSDQSLFPIDSAFKRRWDWQYVPIAKGYDKETRQEINWKIEANTQYYDWWSFLDAVNGEIAKATLSEDKKLGFFFCKADKGDTISAELFVSKVIFYLWNDVFKSETEDSIFKDKEGASITFDRFYKSSYGETTVDKELVEQFLENLKLEPIGQIGEDDGTTSDSPNAGQGQHKESIVAVTLNGERLSSDKYTQFDLYMEILKRLGISTVAPMIEQMKYRRNGCPMTTTSPDRSKINGTGGYNYVEAEGYYFIKGAKSYTLIRILEDLKSEMNLDMIIESK